MADLAFRNARIVLKDEVVAGSLATRDGAIAAIDPGAGMVGEDFGGDYLLPGLVELHTDHLEQHYHPRQNVYWDPLAALQAHDTQIAGAGITTVFDAVRIGGDLDGRDLGTEAGALIGAITIGSGDGRLRAEHFVHLRCELPTDGVVEHFERFAGDAMVRLASVMDHSPGQRQYQSMAHYAAYYQPRFRLSDAEFEAFVAARLDDQARWSDANRRALIAAGAGHGITFASHDDATSEHVAESVRDGMRIAEFPTTGAAAESAHAAGLAVLMGAPNVVRGKSHSGNISATALAREGHLDVLSSDYVPAALLHAAFVLADQVEAITLPAAVAAVSRNPAAAVGLSDRGEIAPGKRADLVRVRVIDGLPVVRAVYRLGERVS
jgi:alpha-D-ribose 1-methylphosphonate 5-triphosphate diphosphatase